MGVGASEREKVGVDGKRWRGQEEGFGCGWDCITLRNSLVNGAKWGCWGEKNIGNRWDGRNWKRLTQKIGEKNQSGLWASRGYKTLWERKENLYLSVCMAHLVQGKSSGFQRSFHVSLTDSCIFIFGFHLCHISFLQKKFNLPISETSWSDRRNVRNS